MISVLRLFTGVLLLFLGSFSMHAQDMQLTVISNVKGAPSELKMSELKTIMSGERQRWADGHKVTIYLMSTKTPIGASTCKKVYNKTGDAVLRYWGLRQLSGQGESPTFCKTVSELENNVAQNPGAIGILDRASSTEDLKVVNVEGKKSF